MRMFYLHASFINILTEDCDYILHSKAVEILASAKFHIGTREI
jgi:hypothetical protein